MGKAKVNIPMCAALVLLLLTMISIHITSGLYARYTTTASGSASARVAKFDVNASLSEDVIVDCSANETSGEYQITIENNSEVAIKYILYVTLKSKDPNLTVDGTDLNGTMTDVEYNRNENNEEIITTTAYPSTFTFEKKIWFTRNNPLAPGAKREHNLTIEIPDGISLTKKVTDQEELNWELEVLVEINVEQAD